MELSKLITEHLQTIGGSMARRVFFSFYFKRDIFRVNQVRKSWITKIDNQKGFFFDNSLWERTKRTGDESLKRLINEGIEGTSVTAVLAGTETFNRRWVRYEILRSYYDSRGILVVRINDLTDPSNGKTDPDGPNPLDYFYVRTDKVARRVYCWESLDGAWAEPRDIAHSVDFGHFKYPINPDLGCRLSHIFRTYRWSDNGYQSFDQWIESAATDVNR